MTGIFQQPAPDRNPPQDAAQRFMAKFDDPSQWFIVPGVAVFDEHEEERWETDLDPATNKPRTVRRVETFGLAELQEHADNMNRQVAAGKPPGLTLGHTTDDPDETKQPETAGWGLNYRVAYSEKMKRHVILHDEYFEPGRKEEVKKYPHRSVERWKKGKFFSPIALLKREPARPLPPVAYRRGNDMVVRYSMEAYSAMDPANASPAATTPPAPGAAAPAAAPVDPDVAKFAALMDGYMGNPDNCAKMKKYMADPAPPAPPAPPKPPEPDKNAASLPSGTNTGLPDMTDKNANQAEVVRYQALETRLARLEGENADLRKGERVARYSKVLADLRGQGYPINEAEELADVQDMTQEQFDKHVDRIKRYSGGQRLPIGGGHLPLERSLPGGDEPLTKEQSDWAVKYQAANGNKTPWNEVFKKAREAVPANGVVRG